jgi:hypothetical protein
MIFRQFKTLIFINLASFFTFAALSFVEPISLREMVLLIMIFGGMDLFFGLSYLIVTYQAHQPKQKRKPKDD